MTGKLPKRPDSQAARTLQVIGHESGRVTHRGDLVAVEEPLEIRVIAEDRGRRRRQSIAVTMRTPGHDRQLAAGFLVSEGVVRRRHDIYSIEHCEDEEPPDTNLIDVTLNPGVQVDLDRLSRNVFVSSSCGVCGKASIEAVREACEALPPDALQIAPEDLLRLPGSLGEAQTGFGHTGGLHAAGLFDLTGRLTALFEDVGRHNALDKLIGELLLKESLPAANKVLMVSGRASFELVQKALLAGIPLLAAVGAPSSLAVELAAEYGMTLVGFLRHDRFNVYAGSERVPAG